MKAKLTRTDIAKLAGVAPSTVSRALSGSSLIPAETAERIRKIAAKSGYQPNLLAKRLAVNRSFNLGFVLPLNLEMAHKGPLRMNYYSDILDGMVSASFKRGYRVVMLPYEGKDMSLAAKLVETVKRREADGLALLGLTHDSPTPARLLKADIPFVLLGSRREGAPSVNWSQGQAIKAMLAKLASLNYERLIYVCGDENYHDALKQGLALSEAAKDTPFKDFSRLEGDYSKTSGYRAAESILGSKDIKAPKRKTCVFLACDRMAMGFYRFCYEHNIRIPHDIGVFGSDGDELAKALHPRLSTISQPRASMGAAAAEMLMDSCEKPEDSSSEVILDGFFAEGDSL